MFMDSFYCIKNRYLFKRYNISQMKPQINSYI